MKRRKKKISTRIYPRLKLGAMLIRIPTIKRAFGEVFEVKSELEANFTENFFCYFFWFFFF